MFIDWLRRKTLSALPVAVVLVLAIGGSASAGVPRVPPEAAWVRPAPTVRHGPKDHPRIALTFDDNYQKPQAFATLRVLKAMGVPATMFVIGHYADLGPKLAKQLAKDGFEIGDHTRSHANSPTLSWRALKIEIGNGTRTFEKITGAPTAPLFRPPGGFTNDYVATAAAAQGFRYVVLWDIDPQDWRGASAAAIRDTVFGNAHNGAIVLLHMAAPHTAEALPAIVDGLRARGYELVTVTDLLKGDRQFADVDPKTAEGKNILDMVAAGYLSGVDGDYFAPYDHLTRTQLARAVLAAAGLHSAAPPGDGSPTDYPAAATAAGLLPAAATPKDADSSLVTRLDLARAVARLAMSKGYDGEKSRRGKSGGDFTDVPADARADVDLAVASGLMRPSGGGLFGADTPAQRRQLAAILVRFVALPIAGPSRLPTSTTAALADRTPSTGSTTASRGSNGFSLTPVLLVVGGMLLAGSLAGLRLRTLAVRRRSRGPGPRSSSRRGRHS